MNPTSLHTSLSCANIPQRCRIDSIIQTRFASTISIFTRGSASNMHQCTIATASNSDKLVWIQTESRDVVTAGLESGFTSFLARSSASNPDSQNQWDQWKRLGQLDLITELPDGSLVDETGAVLGRLCRLASAADLSAAEAAGAEPGYTVTDSTDWQIIPAENLVAAFQALPGTLLAVAADATACRVMLEALEVGTDGVVLATESPADVRQLVQYLQQRKATASGCLQYQAVQVVTVRPVGMGDRACVDLAEAMTPGEGLLVGSFARGLFWVHSECGTSVYINSRPFRVNAGEGKGVHGLRGRWSAVAWQTAILSSFHTLNVCILLLRRPCACVRPSSRRPNSVSV